MPYNRMIPKSGYRFSDKIMRKRQSTISPSTIASRLNRRWDRLSARSCFGEQMQSQPYNLFRQQVPEEVLLGSLPAIRRMQNAARRMSSDGPHQRMRLAQRRQVYASLRTQNPRSALA